MPETVLHLSNVKKLFNGIVDHFSAQLGVRLLLHSVA